MHFKRSYFSADESSVCLIRPGEMAKTASRIHPDVQRFIDQLVPSPDYSYVLVNAMGYSEFYGANSNVDWYGYNQYLDFNGLLNAPLGFGDDYERDKMQGTGWPYGFPSYYAATAYAHHKNTDPQQLGFGDVIFVYANREMKRIELVIRIFNEELRKKGHLSILSRIEAGERVDVSMGCRVPFDLCSICTDWEGVKRAWGTFDPQLHRHPGVAILASHKVKPIRGLAITRKDYCECMLKMRGKVLPDGRKVYVYNDFPRFFDISFVLVGADKTARVMWHLGSKDGAPKAIDLTKLKSASMDKEIPGGTAERVEQDADEASDISGLLGSKDFSADPKHNVRLLLSSLASLGIVATPHEFQGLVLKSFGASPQSQIFDVRCGGVDSTFEVRPECYSEGIAKIFRPLMEDRSAFAPFLGRRLGRTTGKTASSPRAFQRSSLNDKIAQMYNGYRISVLEKSAELFPKVSSVAPIESKGIGPGGLLLGLEPMLHLLSAHLRKNEGEGRSIGIMANLSASNPNLSSVSTIGAGLRSAMNIDKTSSLTQAVSRALETVRGSAR